MMKEKPSWYIPPIQPESVSPDKKTLIKKQDAIAAIVFIVCFVVSTLTFGTENIRITLIASAFMAVGFFIAFGRNPQN